MLTMPLHIHQQAFNHMSLFGCKAPMPCDNWLGLGNYKLESFKSKTVWLNQQLNSMLHANKQALKLIEKSTKCNKDHTCSIELIIPIGNHVLLRDHPEGCNKIQDRYKSDIYMSWWVTTKSLMFTTFSFWIRVNRVLLKWSTSINYSILTVLVHLLWPINPKMMMILQ